MFGVRTALIILCGALWAGTSAPVSANALSCVKSVELFSTSAARYAREAPPPSDAADPQSAEDKQRDHARAIAREQARLASALEQYGEDSIEAARSRIALAKVLRPAAQLKPALEELDLAETVLQTIAPDGLDMAMLLRERGITLSNMRKREEAVAALNAAIKLHSAGPARNENLEALNSQTLSDVLRGLSRFDDALKALNRAQAIYDRNADANAQNLVDVLVNKFIILSRLDEKTTVLEVIARAVALSERALGPYHGTTARALHNQAIAFRRAGAMRESFAAMGKVYAIYGSQGNMVRASEALDDVARTLGRIGCRQEAIGYQTESLQKLVALFGNTHVRVADAEIWLGNYLRDSGDAKAAEPHLMRAIAIFDELLGPENVRSAIAQRELAAVQSRNGQREAAIATLIQSVRALEQGNAPGELRESLHTLAQVLKADGNSNGAILFAKKAVNTQQEIRAANRELPPELSAALAERYRSLYLYLADLLIEKGRLEEAQRVIDLIKSQEMIDFVRGGRPELLSIDGRAPMTKTERKTLSAIDELLKTPFAVADELELLLAQARKKPLDPPQKARLNDLKAAFNQNYKSFQQDVKALIDSLADETSAVQGEIVQLHLDMLGQSRKRLKQFKGRAILMQIASLDDQVHIFVTGANTQVHRTAPIRRAVLAKLAFDAWNATAKSKPDARQKLAKLYDVLVRPVEKDLADSGADVVMLNLEGFLRYIPFAALHSGERYLIEDYVWQCRRPPQTHNMQWVHATAPALSDLVLPMRCAIFPVCRASRKSSKPSSMARTMPECFLDRPS
jgi:tetratricopeptide (TPR) repeat protein